MTPNDTTTPLDPCNSQSGQQSECDDLLADASKESPVFSEALLMLMADFAQSGDLNPNDAVKTFVREALNALNAYKWLTGDLKAAKSDLESAAKWLGVHPS